MLQLVFLALIGGSLASCVDFNLPNPLDASTGPQGTPPLPNPNSANRDASTTAYSRSPDVSVGDSYSGQLNDQQRLKSIHQGIDITSRMCEWYSTDVEQTLCLLSFKALDYGLEELERPENKNVRPR